MKDGVFIQGNARVQVKGLSRTLRSMERAGADAEDMKTLMHSLGVLVARAADIPDRTGRLSTTVRAGKGKTKAVVRAGGSRAPYAPIVHYGWPARGIPPNPYLVNALRSQRERIFRELDRGIEDILKKNDLI